VITDETSTAASQGLARITTGNVQLDAILCGGYPANSLNIVMGEPGSGKTILAENLAFANAQLGGRPILYLTTLSEPLDKIVRYLQQFTFFDEELLSSGAVIYDSLGPQLAEAGIAALVPKLKEAIKTQSPKMIVIDSFKAIHDLSTSVPGMRRMLHEVSGLLTAYDTTAFLVGEYNEDMISTLPEFAVADSMVELARSKNSVRDERYLRVLKLRGSSYQEGLHAFRLGASGLEVFPRLTSPATPPPYVEDEPRVATGVPGLDEMLDGGLWAGTSTLVQGGTGTGKTTIALQFILEGLRRGEPGLYVNFQENPTQLARSIASLGWDVNEARAKGLHLLYTSPVELQIDSILVSLFRTFQDEHIKRVAVDAVGDLVIGATDVQRVLGYLYALGQHFQVGRATSILTFETNKFGETPLTGQFSAMADTIVTLGLERQGDAARRTLQIVKSRGTRHDLTVREVHISASGLVVG
jgi:circadian clock protein KaiC